MTSSRDYEGEYRALGERLQKLRQKHAVLEDKERDKEELRCKLIKELTAAGVDTDNLASEEERLVRVIEERRVQVEGEINGFAQALAEAEAKQRS